jgi:antitoxin ParD1/3/4
MPRNTSVTLGEHFERFIAKQIKAGRFESKSEVVRAAMRLLEEHEKKVAALRHALIDGESSGEAVPLVMTDVLTEARKEAGVKPVDA